MSDSFAFRQFGVSAAAVFALALSACGGGGGGSAAELAAAPTSETGPGAAPADGDSAAAGAPPGAGEGGGGSPPVEERLAVEPGAEAPGPGAENPGPGVSAGEGPGAGAPAAPGGGSTSSGAAMWHVFGEAGTGEGAAALVTSDELAGVSAKAIFTTVARYAKNGSLSGSGFNGYRQRPFRKIDGYDESGLWRLKARRGDDLIWARADSGMTQSSRGSFADDDQMAVGIGHDAVGAVTYKLARAHAVHGSGELLNMWVLDSEAEGANVRKWSSDGGKGAVFRRDDSGGSLWAVVTTDVSGAGDTDWLATGMWAWTPANGAAEDYWFGVFADGGEPVQDRFYNYKGSDLTGVATYAGSASGVYTRPVDGAARNDFFEADVTLTADFSARKRYSYAGEVSGSVSGFEIAGAAIAGAPVLTLEGWINVSGGGASPGTVRGKTSMSFGGNEWTGRWGSQFFGRDDDGGAPSSIAGTFGVAVDPPDWLLRRDRIPNSTAFQAFVGAFAAYRTAWEDTPVRLAGPWDPDDPAQDD